MNETALLRVLLEASLRSVFIAVAVAALLAIGRVQSSAFRHAAWSSVTIAMLLMLWLPYRVPTVAIRLRSSVAPAVTSVTEKPNTPAFAPASAARPALVPGVPAATPLVMTAQGHPVANAPHEGVRWAPVVAGLYGLGVLFFLARWLIGLTASVRLVRSARPVADLGTDVSEASAVTTPITVGVVSPRILLPSGWREWSPATLNAVLAHERAHIERRDPWVRLASYINRTVFWFHPLAWWLERTLATVAEEAADEAGARAMGGRRAYAALLLEMASIARQYRGRVLWHGIGVNSGSRLDQRIRRLVKVGVERPVSKVTTTVIAAGATAALAAVVACRAAIEPPPLKPDPKVVASLAKSQEGSEHYKRAVALTTAEVAALTSRVTANPDDLDAFETLLSHYAPRYDAPWPADRLARIAARRPLVLLAIDRHAAKPLAGKFGVRIFPEDTDPLADREGYAQAKALWLRKAAAPDVTVELLSNAGRFFEAYDPALAEKMLLRAQALKPGSVSGQLGQLYGKVVSGSYGATPLNVMRLFDAGHAQSTVAHTMRATLDQSTDPRVLGGACGWLTNINTPPPYLDTASLGRSYCERAVAMAPGDTWAARQLQFLTERARAGRTIDYLRGLGGTSSLAEIDARLALVPDVDRADATLAQAERAYQFGRNNRSLFEIAATLASRALTMTAPTAESQARTAFEANVLLGAIATLEGRRADAVQYMSAASHVATGGNSTGNAAPVNDLTNYLLKAGERETVAQFFEALVKGGAPPEHGYAEAATNIRAGVMPRQYYYFRSTLNADGTEK